MTYLKTYNERKKSWKYIITYSIDGDVWICLDLYFGCLQLCFAHLDLWMSGVVVGCMELYFDVWASTLDVWT